MAILAFAAGCGSSNASEVSPDGGSDGSGTVGQRKACYASTPELKAHSETLITVTGSDWPLLTMDQSNFYWGSKLSSSPIIQTAPLTGGSPQLVTTFSDSISDFVLDNSGTIYASMVEGVYQSPKDGTGQSATALWTHDLGLGYRHSAIAVDSTAVYTFSQAGLCSMAASLYAISKATGTARTLASDLNCAREIVLDDTYVYVSQDGVGEVASGKYQNATLVRVPKAGGKTEVLASVPYGLSSLHLVGQDIYGILQEKDQVSGNSIVRISTSTGSVEHIGETACVRGDRIEVDDGQVYHVDGLGFLRVDTSGKNLVRIKVSETLSDVAPPPFLVRKGTIYEFKEFEGKIDKHEIQ